MTKYIRGFKLEKWLFIGMLVLMAVSVTPWAVEAVEQPLALPASSHSQSPTSAYDSAPDDQEHGIIMPPEAGSLIQTPRSPEIGGASSTDEYGYTWDDTIPVAWEDATSGFNTGLSGASAGKFVGPVDLDFLFPYYENTYDQVYIGASGFITFTDAGNWPSQSQIPASSEPNDVIAPFWVPMYLSETGPASQIYFLQGGEAPERYFVVEWFEVAGGPPEDTTGGDDRYHFQVILFESGDIRFQYQLMNYVGSSYCGAAGIENSTGEDGLTYLPFCAPAPSNRAVLFSRPQPAARVRVSPTYQSEFIRPGASVLFPLSISNLGDLGVDTFELTVNANWSVNFLDADGLTELVDTNADGRIDTGPILPSATRNVFIKITAPEGLSIGANDRPIITITSTLDPSRSQTVTLQAAVPARFAQIFRDDANGAMSLLFVAPNGSQVNQATSAAWWGYNPAVAETASGQYVYVWQRYRYREPGLGLTAELEAVILNHAGQVLHPVMRLTDHTIAVQDIYDEEPVIAVAPDGTIGIAWRRRIVREGAGGAEENWNIYTAMLDETGAMQSEPVNLTQNNQWYTTNPLSFGAPRYWNNQLAVSQENRFALTWRSERQAAPSGICVSNCKLDDINFAIWNSFGEMIKPPTQLTEDSTDPGEGYSSPTVYALSQQRWLLVYNHNPGGLAIAVLDGQGNLIRGESYIGKFGWSPVARQIPGSDAVMIAWTAWTANNPQIHALVLSSSNYQRTAGPLILTNPAASSGGDYASLTVDAHGHAILTWMDFSANNRRHLYYALLDKSGAIITPTMVFQKAEGNLNDRPHIETGFSGYSNTSKRQFIDVPLTDWSAGWIERLYDAGVSMGCLLTPPHYCPDDFVKRSQMAVFLERGLRGADFKPPAASGAVFEDVPAGAFAASWIELLYADGISSGCGGGNYCPDQAVTRAQMAIFLLRAKYYPDDYTPPPVGGSTGFSDVAPDDFAAAWIKQLAAEGITAGCGGGKFCPDQSVTRAQMAAFLVRNFDLP